MRSSATATKRITFRLSDDVAIGDFAIARLPKQSVVHASKIATVEASRCERIGRLPGGAATAVAAVLRRALAAAAA